MPSTTRSGPRPASDYPGADPPHTVDLKKLASAAASCRGCDLYADTTQTVFGRGPRRAHAVLVGEQPGDVEDRQGEPFVGPAGRELDRALAEIGLDRDAVYLTNAVKHFRWKRAANGKRRLHDKPSAAQANACRPWLTAELASIRPTGVVALGAVAAQSLLGPAFRLTQHRGEVMDWPPPRGPYADSELPIRFLVTTIHPSAILRAGDDAERQRMRRDFTADLRLVAEQLAD